MVPSVMLLYIVGFIPLCTSVRNSNTSCYDIYKMDSGNMDRMTCTGEHIVYHCIPNEKNQEVDVCVQWKWITPGYCPYYDSTSNAIKETRCSLYCLRRDDLEEICICSSRNTDNTSCKTECGKDFTSYKYIFCELQVSSTVFRSVSKTLPTTSVTYQKEKNGNRSLASAIGIPLGVLITIILAAVAILLIYRKKLQYCRKDNTEKSEHTIDIEGQPSEREQLLDGKEQKTEQKLVEYIKENETSSKTSELDGSQKGSSSPKSEKGLVQEIPGYHTNEYSNTESPLENVQLTSPSEPPVQTDDLLGIYLSNMSKAGVEVKEKESNESGEKEGSSPIPHTEEKTESESIKEDEIQSKGKDLYKPSVEGETEVEVVNESKEKKGSSDHTEEKTEMESIKEDNHQSERQCNEDMSKACVEGEEKVSNESGEKEGSSPIPHTEEKTEPESIKKDENQSKGKDNKEETSTDKEESGGVFDDTLESIKKEDDAEKGGSAELQDFLQEVSTRLAKKMLYDVLKNYVTDPQSYYLTDESKIALVKELLPTEYQKAVGIDSDDEKSIAVIYAILQLSLEEEHRPKSGWGRGVKDTDIGVGDDVERLYRVHTLYRDIADPEQISLAGYTKLFKVVFEAVDRLDKKGKCKEDYQEFVKRWENLQRNQWYKDNLNELWSVIQKWSLGSSHTD